MGRRTRLGGPPSARNEPQGYWSRGAERALNTFPPFSIFSTSDGPESTVTADSGTLGIDIGSSATTFWAKEAGDGQTGWSALQFV